MLHMKVEKMKTQSLKIAVEDDLLSISIGVDTLCWACEFGRRYGIAGVKITDKAAFLEAFLRQLNTEKDGDTALMQLFDTAVSEMIENGEEGVELDAPSDLDFG